MVVKMLPSGAEIVKSVHLNSMVMKMPLQRHGWQTVFRSLMAPTMPLGVTNTVYCSGCRETVAWEIDGVEDAAGECRDCEAFFRSLMVMTMPLREKHGEVYGT